MTYYIYEYIAEDTPRKNLIFNAPVGVSFIPESADNTDYTNYLQWVADGNTAEVINQIPNEWFNPPVE